MSLPATLQLYLDEDHCRRVQARVLAIEEGCVACDRTCFYPGGGGQPCDTGELRLPTGITVPILSVRRDESGVIWHFTSAQLSAALVGDEVTLILDAERRAALTRYHSVLHVLNTTALRDYGGWITGVQIAAEYSRIDFKIENFSAALCAELEHKVNEVLKRNLALRARYITEDEFQARPDLLRTLEVRPPVIDGKVRVVEIEGFDAQACGGTHVDRTSELGRFSIFRTENKGKINKRLYVKLEGG
jgi:misacylated tRNA(Ala) deacylase